MKITSALIGDPLSGSAKIFKVTHFSGTFSDCSWIADFGILIFGTVCRFLSFIIFNKGSILCTTVESKHDLDIKMYNNSYLKYYLAHSTGQVTDYLQ